MTKNPLLQEPKVPEEAGRPDSQESSKLILHCSTVAEEHAPETSFLFYIINPDGSEREMDSAFARVDDLGNGETLIRFEDKGSDFDFNDVIVLIRNMVDHLFIDVLEVEAAWHHQLKMKILLEGEVIDDFLLFKDSHKSIEIDSAVSFTCEE